MRKDVAERFWPKVSDSTESGCRLWLGAKIPAGYGSFWLNGRQEEAHRVAWELTNGPIPDGLDLDHYVCDNPPCVNPDHLRPATSKANTLRSQVAPTAVNARKTHCSREGHPLSGDNLHIDSRGRRVCRACKRRETVSDQARARKREWWRKNRGKQAAC